MEVTLKRDYKCAPEGNRTLEFKAGDVLTGKAAEMAINDGAAAKKRKTTPKPEKAKPAAPLENTDGGSPDQEG